LWEEFHWFNWNVGLGSNNFGIRGHLCKNQSKGVTDSIVKFGFVEFGTREGIIPVYIKHVATETFLGGWHNREVKFTLEGQNI